MQGLVFIFITILACGLAHIPTRQDNLPYCGNVAEGEEVFFPHPRDCSKFYHCSHRYPEEMECPSGLKWSVAENICDYPSVANCQISTKTTGTKSKRLTGCENVSEFENVLLPNPEDCSTFIQCVHQKPEVLKCPEGLHWSVSTKQCDEPWIAKCEKSNMLVKMVYQHNSRQTGCEGVPESIDVLLPNPKDCGSYIQCVHQQPMVRPCPAGLHFSTQFNRCEWPDVAKCNSSNICANIPETEDVLLPNPDDCGTYFQCVHQIPVLRQCPSGLHWSTHNYRCEWPELAQCSSNIASRNEGLPNCTNVAEGQEVFFPHPTNCSKFYHCNSEYPVEMECPFGLEWSVASNQCDYPVNANCNKSRRSSRIQNRSNRLTGCENVSEWENVLLPNPEDCSTFIQCVHQQPEFVKCPEGLHWNAGAKQCDSPWLAKCEVSKIIFKMGPQYTSKQTGCEGVPESMDVLLPNPKDCGSYIQCVHQQAIIRPCPAGLHFSTQFNKCEWPNVSKCNSTNICDNVPETEDILLPNLNDCGKYFQCVHQMPVLRQCPSGLHWSTATKRCEWPGIAHCLNP